MNALPDGAAHFLAEFERLGGRLAGRGAGVAQRRAAIAAFGLRGFPTAREESWRYTDLSALARRPFRVAEGPEGLEPGQALPCGRWPAHELVFVNGFHCPELGTRGEPPEGVGIETLASVLGRCGMLPGGPAEGEAQGEPFVALNAAFAADGACIAVAERAQVERPIHLLYVMAGDLASFPRTRIEVGAAARVCVIESFWGLEGAAGLNAAVTEILAGPEAVVQHCRVQLESARATHLGSLFIEQGARSQVDSQSISLGAALARHDIRSRLGADGAALSLSGLYLVDGRRHVDHHTRIEHLKPGTVSREFFKGIAAGAGRAVFNGKVVVHAGAVKTDAEQANKNLLLSPEAEVDTKPELEIYTDDVRCAHGATVGQLDEDALFYLRSRGLGEAAARRVLLEAFALEVLARVPVEPLRAELVAELWQHLPSVSAEASWA